ncbi:MAG: haloalkane dehalogenase, partial [Candidatus Promineifilaceae bacterium]
MTTILRTPDEQFENLPDFPFEPHYIEMGEVRIHYLDEGSADSGETILCLHGEPSWSFLYRKMIPILVPKARVLAPDFIGFGRSDKFAEMGDYSYNLHYDTIVHFIETLDLRDITLVCQDWGGLIGLTVAANHPERFARLVILNTFLPVGKEPMPEAFTTWRSFSERVGLRLPVGRIIRGACANPDAISDEVIAAYEAPYPERKYKAGAAVFPLLVPVTPNDPGAAEMRQARKLLAKWEKPVQVLFSDSDPMMSRAVGFFRRLIPGAAGQPKITIENAGHFLQEEKG